jgi:hypothetical protein
VIGTDARADAAEVLRRCRMPEDEIRWVLTAGDPAVVHMILELHRERLEEELVERRKALGGVETWLAERAISDPVDRSGREGIHDHHSVDLSTRLEVLG